MYSNDLKHDISQMEDADLLKMILHHNEYRQEALDYATNELARRKIPFVPLPPKPPLPQPKKKSRGNIISIVAGFIFMGITANTVYVKLSNPEGITVDELLPRLIAAGIVIAVLFLRLTTSIFD